VGPGLRTGEAGGDGAAVHLWHSRRRVAASSTDRASRVPIHGELPVAAGPVPRRAAIVSNWGRLAWRSTTARLRADRGANLIQDLARMETRTAISVERALAVAAYNEGEVAVRVHH